MCEYEPWSRSYERKSKRREDPDDATERELIEMEFQSMVENLSLG
jgi:hypothetical protein